MPSHFPEIGRNDDNDWLRAAIGPLSWCDGGTGAATHFSPIHFRHSPPKMPRSATNALPLVGVA